MPALFFLVLFLFIPAAFAANPSSETYDLNGYDVSAGARMTSSTYTMIGSAVPNMGIAGAESATYLADVGFSRRVGNSPPDVNVNAPNGGECVSGTYPIDFNVYDKDNSRLFARISYSTAPLAFQNDITTDTVLNSYAAISQLNCSNPNWSKSRNCTWQWDTSGVADEKYRIDMNVWDVAKRDFAQDSSDANFRVDNTAPEITISVPEDQMTTEQVLITFTVDKGAGCDITGSTILVKIDSEESSVFDLESHCTESGTGYSCSYYQTGLSTGDWNVAVKAEDAGGNEGYSETIFTLVPVFAFQAVQPSGGFVSGPTQIQFQVKNTVLSDVYVVLHVTDWFGEFDNNITGTLHLDDHANISGLSCDGTHWSDWRTCTYQWDSSTLADGDYFVDINAWNGNNVTATKHSNMPSIIDNTAPVASVGGVSSTPVYEDHVYLGCADSGSGCKPQRWLYFATTPACSTSKADYTWLTYNSYWDVLQDNSDYICLWVEDYAGHSDTAVSEQLHVDHEVYVVSSIPSERQTFVTQDLNNECTMYVDENMTISCDFKSTIKISEHKEDLNSAWTEAPDVVRSPPKTIRVLYQSELEAFYHEDYYLEFVSEERTIASQGDSKNYPVTVVRRRLIPLLTNDGDLEVGVLTIKIRQR